MKFTNKQLLSLSILLCLFSCSSNNDDWYNGNNDGYNNEYDKSSSTLSPILTTAYSGIQPTFDSTIYDYDGTLANDADKDIVGTDTDFYWEANTFSNIVNITYNGSTATVTSSNNKIITDTNGAYVTVDFQTNSVSNVEIVLNGSTTDGGLKIYGAKKFKLSLNGVSITSTKGPAITTSVRNECS